MIEIPGVGTVEAKNAASEATLREILKAMQGVQKNTGGGGGGAGGGGAGGGGAGAAAGANVLGKTSHLLGKTFGILVGVTGKVTGALGMVAGGATKVVTGFLNVTAKTAQIIDDFAKVEDSLTAAANTFRKIPAVGEPLATIFGAVAGALESTTKAYYTAASAGATFGGSVNQMISSASAVGLTFDQFANVIKNNGQSLALLGGTTEQGAKRFVELGKQMRNSQVGNELLRLGYSTEDINNGLAKYTGLLARTGQLQGKSNAELTAGAGNYLKQLDALARLTGESRESKEKEIEEMRTDAAFRQLINNMDEKQARMVEAYVTSFPKQQQKAVRSMIAMGNIVDDAAVNLNSQMPGLSQEIVALGQAFNRGEKVEAERLGAIQDRAIVEADAYKKSDAARLQAQYNAEQFGDTYLFASELAARKQGQFVAVMEEQAKAVAKSNQAEAVAKSKQQLAAASNTFTQALANPAILNSMMKLYGVMTDIVQKFVVPAFEFLTAGLNKAITFIGTIFGDQSVKQTFGQVYESMKGVVNDVLGMFKSMAAAVDWNAIREAMVTLLVSAGELIMKFVEVTKPAFVRIGEIGSDLAAKLGPIFTDIAVILSKVMTVLQPLLKPIVDTIGTVLGYFFDQIGNFVKIVKGIFTGDTQAIVDGFGNVFKDFFKMLGNLWGNFKDLVSAGVDGIKRFFGFGGDNKSPAAPTAQSTPSPQSAPATAQAQAARTSMENEAQKKKAAEERKAQEAKVAKAKADMEKGTAASTTNQNTPEGQLATLNTNVEQLIRISRAQYAILESQLTVQKGFGSDVFKAA